MSNVHLDVIRFSEVLFTHVHDEAKIVMMEASFAYVKFDSLFFIQPSLLK